MMNKLDALLIKRALVARKISELGWKKMSKKRYNERFDKLKVELLEVRNQVSEEIVRLKKEIEKYDTYNQVLDINAKWDVSMEWYYTEEKVKEQRKGEDRHPYVPQCIMDTVGKVIDADDAEEDRMNRILGIGKYAKTEEKSN